MCTVTGEPGDLTVTVALSTRGARTSMARTSPTAMVTSSFRFSLPPHPEGKSNTAGSSNDGKRANERMLGFSSVGRSPLGVCIRQTHQAGPGGEVVLAFHVEAAPGQGPRQRL